MDANVPVAADLPDGSIVVGRELPGLREVVYIKDHPTSFSAWRGTNGSHVGDWLIDRLFDGGEATVLRVGTGV